MTDFYGGRGAFQSEHESSQSAVHIRLRQRTGRKFWTTADGLATDLDLHKILKMFRKMHRCGGTIIDDDEHGKVIQLQGDHRDQLKEFLIFFNIAKEDEITKHGF